MQTQPSQEEDNLMPPSIADSQLRAIAYSMDTLIPGFYFWCGTLTIRFGGSLPEPTYPGTIHSPIGIAIVLPGYRIYSTYQQSYDPQQNRYSPGSRQPN
jgi:hypothetical protein